MKNFAAAFLVISACVAGTLAGSPSPCSPVVYEVKDLSPWIQDAISTEIKKYKDAPMAELEEAMNVFLSNLLSSDGLTQNDIDILTDMLAACITPKGVIHVEGTFWGCYINVHIEW